MRDQKALKKAFTAFTGPIELALSGTVNVMPVQYAIWISPLCYLEDMLPISIINVQYLHISYERMPYTGQFLQ